MFTAALEEHYISSTFFVVELPWIMIFFQASRIVGPLILIESMCARRAGFSFLVPKNWVLINGLVARGAKVDIFVIEFLFFWVQNEGNSLEKKEQPFSVQKNLEASRGTIRYPDSRTVIHTTTTN